MSIKGMSLENLQELVDGIKERYTQKTDLGAVAALDEVGMDNLADALKAVINGKVNAATTLAGYGITDGMTATEVASAISTAIAGADHLSRVKVASTDAISLTAAGADKKIYMVPKAGAAEGEPDKYDEYMVIDGKLERVGDWQVDLSDYAKTTAVTQMISTALASYAKTADVTSAINTAVSGLIKLTDLSAETTGTGNVVTAMTYDKATGKIKATKEITALQESDFVAYTSEEIQALFK